MLGTTMSAISAVGLDEIYTILIIGGVILVCILIAIFIWVSGCLSTIMNGVDRKTYERLVYDSIPELRKIAKLYSSEPVGIEAHKFLTRWYSEIEPSLERLGQSKRRETLRAMFQSFILPILEAYEELITQKETMT